MTTEMVNRLELREITKSFPGILANDQVSFAVAPGEIHAVLGENGAGKSTLVKMIYGIMQPDSGKILFDDHVVQITNPKFARNMGVGMVFQHFSLFEAMTVLENIALGMDHRYSYSELEARIRGVLREYELVLEPHRIVSTLSVGERQRIEIVRALLLEPRLLIMDEPTSVLTTQEVAQLFKTLRALSARGCSILYISHKLHEVQELCNKATILRNGKIIGICDPRLESPRSMAEMMIGGTLKTINKDKNRNLGDARFIVNDFSLAAENIFDIPLNDISFSVRAGEIFGIAGVAGNGQTELLLALSGEIQSEISETIRIDGTPVGTLNISQRRAQGLCVVPEERNGHGAVLIFSLIDNVLLTARDRKNLVRRGFIDARRAEIYTGAVVDEFAVKTNNAHALAGSLSGGNLQKFIMGREIMQQPEVLIVSQPTWGVDAGAAGAIHQALVDLSGQGSAVLMISQDLDELLALCDRMVVMNQGRISDILKVDEVSIDEIGLLMGGVHGDPSATMKMTGKISGELHAT